MDVNEWTQRTDYDYEERMCLGLAVEEDEGEDECHCNYTP